MADDQQTTHAVARYRKRPVVIEAIQWDDSDGNLDAILRWADESVSVDWDTPSGKPHLYCNTLEGSMFANKGDWIIKGVSGEFYPCKPEIFAATYDRAGGDGLRESPAATEAKS